MLAWPGGGTRGTADLGLELPQDGWGPMVGLQGGEAASAGG